MLFSLLGSFWCLFQPQSPHLEFYQTSFCHTTSLMSIYFHTKSQSKAVNGCPDINRYYSQISGIFHVRFLTPQTKGEESVSCLIQAWDILMLKI